MFEDDYKIILTSHCGTYPSWLAWTVASVYNSVDDIVIINGGYDPEHPELGNCIPLEREKRQLKELDINNKVMQLLPNNDKLKSTGLFTEGKDETARSGNMTLAYQYALSLAKKKGYDLDKTWCLKLDSDQIADESFTRENLIDLSKSTIRKGYRFAQYSDFFRSYDRVQSLCHWCAGQEGNMTNDGALFFKLHARARAGGQGSPDIGEEFPVCDMYTYHMRRIHPPDIDEREYHFKRFWYHTWGPNQIMEYGYNRDTGKKMTNEQVFSEAERLTDGVLSSYGHDREYFNNDSRFPKSVPKVIEIGYLNYIKQGFPKDYYL